MSKVGLFVSGICSIILLSIYKQYVRVSRSRLMTAVCIHQHDIIYHRLYIHSTRMILLSVVPKDDTCFAKGLLSKSEGEREEMVEKREGERLLLCQVAIYFPPLTGVCCILLVFRQLKYHQGLGQKPVHLSCVINENIQQQ